MLAGLGFLTRLDHIGPLLAIALLSLEPVHGPLLAALAVGSRNYLVGGVFCLDDPSDLAAIACSTIDCIVKNIKISLLASTGNKFTLPAITLITGTALTFAAILWRPKTLWQ